MRKVRNQSVSGRQRTTARVSFGAAILAGALTLGFVPAASAAPADDAWAALTSQLEALIDEAEADGVRMGVTVEDLSGTYEGAIASVGSQERYKAASVIKLPLLALLMDYADEGTLSLDEMIRIEAGDSNIVGGSGTLRDRAFPLDISVRELMELMVQVSDNTATNVLIDRAGGFDAVNAYIAGLGFDDMWLGRKMIHPASPPLQENWLNSDEVTALISMLYRHEILSAASSDHIIDLMKGQLVNTKFGAVVPRAVLANKTGELGDVSHDSGLILIPGREVSLAATTAFSSTRPRTEVDLYVQRAATIVYEFLQQPLPEAPAPVDPAAEAPVTTESDGAPAGKPTELAATGPASPTPWTMLAALLVVAGAATLVRGRGRSTVEIDSSR